MNSDLDPQDSLRDLIQIQPDEQLPESICDDGTIAVNNPDDQPYEGAGFPGCGDGSDDLADFNANEADDYRGE